MGGCKRFTPAVLVPLSSCPLPADVAAQAAVVSDRLRGVLGDSSEENEAAPSDSPIQVAVPAPRLAPCHQTVSYHLPWADEQRGWAGKNASG